jgi:predicted dehydrogenase
MNLNRRSFLKQSGLVAAGAVGLPYFVRSSALGADGTVAPSNRITMGAIGVGGMGMGDLDGFVNRKEVHMLAVCDVDDNHAAEAKKKVDQKNGNTDCATTRDFRQVVERKDIDAIMTATPDQWHALIGIAAAKAGKHVHSQKPLGYSIPEGRAIVNAVKKYGIVWQTGSQQRSDAKFRLACELVRNGAIGKVTTVKVGLPNKNSVNRADRTFKDPPASFDYNMWLGPAPEAPYCDARCHWNFRWISDYAGGQITDWAGHHCDIAQWAMGTELTGPVEIEGTGKWPTDPLFNTVEEYQFFCKYKEGFTMDVAGKYPNGVRFEGDKGWLFVTRGQINADPKSILETKFGPNDIRLYKSDDHQRNFLDCIKTKKECIASPEIAHHSIAVGHLGLIAIKLGRKVQWDPQKEQFINDSEADKLLQPRPLRAPWRL